MYSFSRIVGFGALIAAASAVPMKREIVVNTVIEVDVVTEMLTATVWVDGTDAPAYHEAQYTYAASEPSSTQAVTTHALPSATSSIYVAPPPPPPPQITSSTSSAYVAPPVPTTTSTSEWIAPASAYSPPASTTPVYTPPATTTPVYTPPAATTSVYTPPAATTPVYTPPAATTTSTSAEAAAITGASTSGHNVGEITYYDVGQGSCGNMNTDSEMVVAIPYGIMNKPKMCGKSVTISYQGATHVAQIVDTCMGCKNTDLDMSPALFKAVAPNGDGRVKNVEWWFN